MKFSAFESQKKISLLMLCICMLSNSPVFSQISQNFSQYMFSGILINPGCTGMADKSSVSIFYRRQWTNLNRPPSIQTINFQTPLDFGRMGIGVQIVNQTAFAERVTSANLSYSYRIRLSKGICSFGLVAGISQYSFTVNSLMVKDDDDSNLQNQLGFRPDLGVGVFYQGKKLFGGVSAMNLLNFATTYTPSFLSNQKYFYVFGGYKFPLGRNFILTPSMLLKWTNGLKIVIEPTVHIKYLDLFWIGGSLRMNNAASFQVGFNLGKVIGNRNEIKLGYAYDWPFATFGYSKGASHEIMLTTLLEWDKSPKQIRKSKIYYSPTFY